jgi:flagellar biosynthesis/type III secretory pathway protein FliH
MHSNATQVGRVRSPGQAPFSPLSLVEVMSNGMQWTELPSTSNEWREGPQERDANWGAALTAPGVQADRRNGVLLSPLGRHSQTALHEELFAMVEAELGRAREEAERIIAEAEQTAQALVQKRCEEAVAEVRTEQCQAFASAAEACLEQIREQWRGLCKELYSQIATLAVEVAEKIIHRQLDEHPELVIEMAREALSQLSQEGKLRLVVSEVDADLLSEHMAALLSVLPPATELTIVGDAALRQGDVIVQGEGGEIDARIDTQLNTIAAVLNETNSDAGAVGDGKAAAA